ncbi:hypothetical protein Tco_0814313 [Tanacetum coccineum]
MVLNSPCLTDKKELTSPKQTALALASPKQAAIGKDFPNPFMAGSLPKTIKQSNDPPLSRGYTLRSGDDSLKLMELMANCTKLSAFVRRKNREICKGFNEIIDFLTSSHIYYALTENPIISVSLIEQFWQSAILSTTEEGLQAIFAHIDGHNKTITEASLRRHLKVEDAEGISSLSNEEIFEQLAHMGSKKTAWDQFSSNIATAIIFLATNRVFNFSIFIFEAMVKNLDSPHKFLMYPRIDGLEKDLQQTKKTYSTALTKLVLRVKKLEYKLKQGKARRKAKIVLSNDEEIEEEVHEKPSDETEVIVQEETPTEIVEDLGSGEKGEMEISTANIQVSTASPPKVLKVSIAAAHVYTRRNASKSKDKGKAIMTEPEPPKKLKKKIQVQMSLKAALELQRQLDQRQEVPTQATQTYKIDWNDPSVLRYQAMKNRPVSIAQARRNMITYLKNQGGYKKSYFKRMSYNDIRPIFERVWDHVNTFILIRSEIKEGSSKPSERKASKPVKEERIQEEDVKPEQIEIEKKVAGTRRKTLARRRSGEKKSEENVKRQKLEDDAEKEELRVHMDIVLKEDIAIGIESLDTSYSIVDWKTHVISENLIQDVLDLYRVVKEMYKSTSPEGYDRLLWGDLITLFDSSKEDEIWKAQQDYTLINWSLYDSCGVHVLLMNTRVAIHMLVEKKYPLTQEMLSNMLSRRLEVDHESEIALELIRFTRSQIEEAKCLKESLAEAE